MKTKEPMPHFSERNGYVIPSKVLIRETITTEIENCIYNCYSALEEDMRSIITHMKS